MIIIDVYQEYASHPLVHDTNRHFARKFMECNQSGTFIGLTEIQLKVDKFVRDQKIYSIETNIEK